MDATKVDTYQQNGQEGLLMPDFGRNLTVAHCNFHCRDRREMSRIMQSINTFNEKKRNGRQGFGCNDFPFS